MTARFVICIENSEYPASLELRKVYSVVADTDADRAGLLRVVDESGDDYLYPASLFVEASLSSEAEALVAKAS